MRLPLLLLLLGLLAIGSLASSNIVDQLDPALSHGSLDSGSALVVNRDAQTPSCGKNSGSAARRVAYYQSWNTRLFTCNKVRPSQLNVAGFTHVIMAFLAIDPATQKVQPMHSGDEDLYKEFLALPGSVSKWISIGGSADGSIHNGGSVRDAWAQMARSKETRKAFINSLKQFLEKWKFSGVDLHWQWPEYGEIPINTSNQADLITELRQALGKGIGISIVLPLQPQHLGAPDIGRYAEHVDWFNVLAHDLHGAWEPSSGGLKAHADLKEIDNLLESFWLLRIDPKKLNLGISNFARGYTLTDKNCNYWGCPFKGPSQAGWCTDQPGVLSQCDLTRIANEKKTSWKIIAGGAMTNEMSWDNQWANFDDDTTRGFKVELANNRCMGGTALWAIDYAHCGGEAPPPPGPAPLPSGSVPASSGATSNAPVPGPTNVPSPGSSILPSGSAPASSIRPSSPGAPAPSSFQPPPGSSQPAAPKPSAPVSSAKPSGAPTSASSNIPIPSGSSAVPSGPSAPGSTGVSSGVQPTTGISQTGAPVVSSWTSNTLGSSKPASHQSSQTGPVASSSTPAILPTPSVSGSGSNTLSKQPTTATSAPQSSAGTSPGSSARTSTEFFSFQPSSRNSPTGSPVTPSPSSRQSGPGGPSVTTSSAPATSSNGSPSSAPSTSPGSSSAATSGSAAPSPSSNMQSSLTATATSAQTGSSAQGSSQATSTPGSSARASTPIATSAVTVPSKTSPVASNKPSGPLSSTQPQISSGSPQSSNSNPGTPPNSSAASSSNPPQSSSAAGTSVASSSAISSNSASATSSVPSTSGQPALTSALPLISSSTTAVTTSQVTGGSSAALSTSMAQPSSIVSSSTVPVTPPPSQVQSSTFSGTKTTSGAPAASKTPYCPPECNEDWCRKICNKGGFEHDEDPPDDCWDNDWCPLWFGFPIPKILPDPPGPKPPGKKKCGLLGCGCGFLGSNIGPSCTPNWVKDIDMALIVEFGMFPDPCEYFGCNGGCGLLGCDGFCFGKDGCDPCPPILCPNGRGPKPGKPPKPISPPKPPGAPKPTKCSPENYVTVTNLHVICGDFKYLSSTLSLTTSFTSASTFLSTSSSSTIECHTPYMIAQIGCDKVGHSDTTTISKTFSNSLSTPAPACSRGPLSLDDDEGPNDPPAWLSSLTTFTSNFSMSRTSMSPSTTSSSKPVSTVLSSVTVAPSASNPITIAPSITWSLETSLEVATSTSAKPNEPMDRFGYWNVSLHAWIENGASKLEWNLYDPNGYEAGAGTMAPRGGDGEYKVYIESKNRPEKHSMPFGIETWLEHPLDVDQAWILFDFTKTICKTSKGADCQPFFATGSKKAEKDRVSTCAQVCASREDIQLKDTDMVCDKLIFTPWIQRKGAEADGWERFFTCRFKGY